MTHEGKSLPSCPVCGKTAFLAQPLDRFFHVDGTDNTTCWLPITRGVISPVDDGDPQVLFVPLYRTYGIRREPTEVLDY
jgi:hypothetical protein